MTVKTRFAGRTPLFGQPLGPPLVHGERLWAVAFSPDGRTALTGSGDHTARRWRVPVALTGSTEEITLWSQVATATELDEDNFRVRFLTVADWQERKRRLEELKGEGGTRK